MGKSKVKFSVAKTQKDIMKYLTNLQTDRLIAYAEERVEKIGRRFSAWDRTGNLLDSICYAVYYNGTAKKYGYYRGTGAHGDSYLHELSKPPLMQEVDGRRLAQEFLSQYSSDVKGWEIVFGVLAPYWAYWERGHENIMLGHFVKFRVMAQQYDQIRRQLTKPVRVSMSIKVPKYSKSKS